MIYRINLLLITISFSIFALKGDINHDSKITLEDCKLISDHVAKGTISSLNLQEADIDNDNKISVCDAMRLHQYLGGIWKDTTGQMPISVWISEKERAYLSKYEEMCSKFESMTPQSFLQKYPRQVAITPTSSLNNSTYFKQIDSIYNLSENQKEAIRKNGFVILPALNKSQGFGEIYAKVFKNDLPVFVTSDMILDAIYKSYDKLFANIETATLIPQMDSILQKTLTYAEDLKEQKQGEIWSQSLNDLIIYLHTARTLLKGGIYQLNDFSLQSKVDSILTVISKEQLSPIDFWGEKRTIDFSQFKPRGHYEPLLFDRDSLLSKYFKCMMWLGRADCAFNLDSLRQVRDFILLHHCIKQAGSLAQLATFNNIISDFVGDIDGLAPEALETVFISMSNKPSIDSLILNERTLQRFKITLAEKGFGNQFILSQALWKDPGNTRPEIPKIGQLSGQRFILDSYLLGHTVEWYVKDRNKPYLEEVAFCLGNNEALTVLENEISTYTTSIGDYLPLHARLGAGRVLFDNYPTWNKNLYTIWLDALRELSKQLPSTTPDLMRSHSWMHKQMNTQLVSWAQLRHNTLLYAKQSNTGVALCFYPDGYVEPYPEFYKKVGLLMEKMQKYFPQDKFYFDNWKRVTDTLALIASIELEGKAIPKSSLDFLNTMLVPNVNKMCAPPYLGWYPQLFYEKGWRDCESAKPCIADVHTIPPSMIKPDNMVLHAATGEAQVIIANLATGDSCGTLYVGGIGSFYQYDVSPILRKTDSEWNNILKMGTEKQPTWIEQYK